MEPVAELLVRVLLFFAVPLWLLAGFLDYACHRRLRIEHSAGTPESRLHLAMLLELGLGVSAALLLELNAGAFVLVFMGLILHEGTMWLDLAYASASRTIPWFEQLVHGVQQTMPWIGTVSLVVLHPAQALSVVGLGEASADWRLLLKQPPLPTAYLLTVGGVALLAVVLPFASEYLRCRRAIAATALETERDP